MRIRTFRCAVVMAAMVLASCGGGGDKGGQTVTDPPPSPPPPQDDDVTWVKANAVPLRTDAPGDEDFSDLMPLKAMIGNARIVALGEGTHGSAEFFRMKHRLLRFLVKEMGFNTFAIEATWPESYDVDRYVHGGPGTAEKGLAGLYFWTWHTQEVADMVDWMRAHDQSPGAAPRVSFRGFDMQFARRAMNDVQEYLRTADPAAADSSVQRYACFRRWQDTLSSFPLYTNASAAERATCRAGVGAVWSSLSDARGRYAAAGFGAGYEHALQAARVVVQNEEQRAAATSQEQGRLRDQFMAENVAWLLNEAGPNARMVLWAHNYHVSHDDNAMGRVLREQFGTDVVNVGFLFDHGSANAYEADAGGKITGFGPALLDPAPAGTYEANLERAALPRMLLDLRHAPTTGSNVWLAGPRRMRELGAVYYPSNPEWAFFPVSLPQRFDVVIWLEEVHPTALLPWS